MPDKNQATAAQAHSLGSRVVEQEGQQFKAISLLNSERVSFVRLSLKK